jgi:hypothetical protein
MRTTISAALLCALLAPAVLTVAATAAPTPAPAPAAGSTAPPEIYHITVRPLCSALHTKIAPAIGMMLQNDQAIAKTPDMFKQYSQAQFTQSKAQQNMTVYHMENLVLPMASNILAVQKLLDDPSVFPATANNEDDRRKLELKDKVLKALADQQASLDIINGFVETQQLADMQHEGFGYIRAMTGNDQRSMPGGRDALSNVDPTPDPLGRPPAFDDTVINAGLPTNPYELDLTRVPGLVLGFNPVSALREGVVFTQTQGQKSEKSLAKSVDETVKICGGEAPAPASTP